LREHAKVSLANAGLRARNNTIIFSHYCKNLNKLEKVAIIRPPDAIAFPT